MGWGGMRLGCWEEGCCSGEDGVTICLATDQRNSQVAASGWRLAAEGESSFDRDRVSGLGEGAQAAATLAQAGQSRQLGTAGEAGKHDSGT